MPLAHAQLERQCAQFVPQPGYGSWIAVGRYMRPHRHPRHQLLVVVFVTLEKYLFLVHFVLLALLPELSRERATSRQTFLVQFAALSTNLRVPKLHTRLVK